MRKKVLHGLVVSIFLICLFVMLPGKMVSAKSSYCQIKIYNNSGSQVERTYRIRKGRSLTLPSVFLPEGKTLLGYSTKANNHTSPTYYLGKTIKVTKNLKLYNVTYNSAKETDLTGSQLLNINNVKYENVIFVGDSRTYFMFEQALKKSSYPAQNQHIYYIAKIGSGLSWLKTTAYPRLTTLLKQLNSKKTAIIFNHGVNDLKNMNSYIKYMKSIAPKLKANNCTLYYMSVNPLSTASRNYYNKKRGVGKTPVTESGILKFNSAIQSSLCGNGKPYIYINTFAYLNHSGFSYTTVSKYPGITDGAHYSIKTSKRIYQYVMTFLKKH